MTEENEQRQPSKKPENPGAAANYLLISAGSIFTSMVIAGFIVGYALDYLFGTTPWLFLGCGVLGFVGGMQKVLHLTKRLDSSMAEEKKNDQ